MQEQIKPKGVFTLKVYKKGVLVETFSENNLVVVGGRTAISKLLGGDVGGNSVTEIGFGDGTSPVNILDSEIQNVFKKAIISATYPSAGVVDINWTLEEDEAEGMSITEFGLFVENGSLFARKVREVIEKTTDIRLEGKWQLIF